MVSRDLNLLPKSSTSPGLLTSFTYFLQSVLQRSDWFQKEHVLHPLTVGAVAFACLFFYLRVSSNRTLARDDVSTFHSSLTLHLSIPQDMHTNCMDLRFALRSHMGNISSDRINLVPYHNHPGYRPRSRPIVALPLPVRQLDHNVRHVPQCKTTNDNQRSAGALCV
jgi:hypothetical protein